MVSACTAAVHNFTGALVVRILLGVTEAPFYPGAIYMLSLFYTRREIATRISILYSESTISLSLQAPISHTTGLTERCQYHCHRCSGSYFGRHVHHSWWSLRYRRLGESFHRYTDNS